MIAFLLCGLIAGACAAPQYFNFHPRHRPQPYFHNHFEPYENDNIFDTGKFWADLSREMRELDDMISGLTRRFPTSISQQGIVGSEYKITIPLPGYDEKDIIVKARDGLLMIQANHKVGENSVRNYLDVRTLPDTVNVTGTWIFETGVLKITFPLKDGVPVQPTDVVPTEVVPTTTAVPVVDSDTTSKPVFQGSREEIENNGNEEARDIDADVGLGRGDLGKQNEIYTNEIPDRQTVEATTYAVDLKDEVEFVPVKY